MRYAVLLRGINVGGRNKVPMADLRRHLSARFDQVSTYIASGNVVLESPLPASEVEAVVEELLPTVFSLDSAVVRALALDPTTCAAVLDEAPAGFGEDDDTYRYLVGFYMGVGADDVRPCVPEHPDVDVVTYGQHAFYHRRVSALATRSRVGQVIGTPVYGSLTLRNWRTTLALADRLGLR